MNVDGGKRRDLMKGYNPCLSIKGDRASIVTYRPSGIGVSNADGTNSQIGACMQSRSLRAGTFPKWRDGGVR